MLKTLGLAMLVLGIAWAGLLAAAEAPSVPPMTRPATQPGKELTLDLGNGASMKLVLIPAGKFLMGSSKTEKDRIWDEVQHEVTISKPFYLGATHVTVDQFALFVKESGYKTDAEKVGWSMYFEIKDGKSVTKPVNGLSWHNPGFEQKGNHPVMQVTWNDAQAFCAWLSKKSGKMVVLPTEAQWEYACRAGTKTAFPWGDKLDDGKGWANCADRSFTKNFLRSEVVGWEFFRWDDGFVYTAPVGSFKANAFGLFDMSGNARQWCQDWYGDYKKGAVTDPTGADAGDLRVLRGGSWTDLPEDCRSACRSKRAPNITFNYFGFRVAVLASGAPDAE